MKTLMMILGLALLTAAATGCGMLLDAATPEKEAAPPAARAPTQDEVYEAEMKTLSETSCEAYPAAFDADFQCCRYGQDKRARQIELNAAAAKKFARCGQWVELFERLDKLGYSDEVLTAIDPELDVTARFVEVLASGQPIYTQPKAHVPAKRLATWLAATKGEAECKAIAPHNQSFSATVLPELAFFHFTAGCGASVLPMARANLAHESFGLRIQACDILGKYGGKGDVAKLELLGRSDAYRVAAHSDSSGRFVASRFPVRERCQTAAVNLLLNQP